MGLSIIDNYNINEIINKNVNLQLINEQNWLDDLLKLGKSAFENEDLMKAVIKQLDDDVPVGKKVKLPEVDAAGKKLSRSEQIDEFAKTLKTDAEAIETAYKSNEALSQSSFAKFNEFITSSATVKGRQGNDALLNALVQQGLKKHVFEKEGSEWLKMYNDVVAAVEAEMAAHIDSYISFTEDDMLKFFNEKINEKLESLPDVKNGTRKVSDYQEYYDWAWKKFTTEGGNLDGILGTPKFVRGKSIWTPSKDRSAMRGKSNPITTELSPEDLKRFTMSRNFTYVEELLHSIINYIKKIFTGVDEIKLRVEQRQLILESYDYQNVLESGVFPDDLKGLLRGHYSDLQMLGTIEKNFLKQWDQFVEGMKQSGWSIDKLEKAFSETELYGGYWQIFFKSESLLESLKDYEIVYRNAIEKNYSPVRAKLDEFINTMSVQLQEAKSKFEAIKAATKEEKHWTKKLIKALGTIFTPRKILSLLSYWSLFTPKAIGKMLRLASGGSGNIKTILYGFIAVDIGMVIWKKTFKTVYAFLYYSFMGITHGKTGNEVEGTYEQQFLNEVKNIWVGIFTGTFSELTNEDGWDWIKGFDIEGSYLWQKYIVPFRTTSPDVADKNIQMSYNERFSLLWNTLDKKEQEKTIETLSDTGTGNFSYFAHEVKKEPEKIIAQNPNVTKEDLDKILLSRVGLVNVEKFDFNFDFVETLKQMTQKQMSGEEMLEPEKQLFEKIKKSTDVGVFRANKNFYYITRDDNNISNYKFKFQKIPFIQKYRIFEKKIGKNSYVIYFDNDIDKKPTKQEKQDLINNGIDMTKYVLNSNNEFTKKDDAEEVVKILNNKIPKSEPDNIKLSIKQFADLL